MSAPEAILLKIKLLLNLATSSNLNEAENARTMVDKLVAKYNVSEEELKSLEDKKPLYGEENKLFTTVGIVSWRQQLAVVAKFFFCHIVQEELVPGQGLSQYNYYVYGDPKDEGQVKFAFNAFAKKVDELILTKCIGRGPIYISSYGEGVVESIKNNIYWEGIEIPEVKAPARPAVEEQKELNNGTSNLSVQKEKKEKPEDKTVDVNSQSIIKDIQAYFKGLDDGKNISLTEVLELEAENERAKELQRAQEEAGGGNSRRLRSAIRISNTTGIN